MSLGFSIWMSDPAGAPFRRVTGRSLKLTQPSIPQVNRVPTSGWGYRGCDHLCRLADNTVIEYDK